VGLVHLALADQGISILLPEGWEVTVHPDGTLEVGGEPDEGGFRPTIIIEFGVPEEPGHAWYDAFVDGVVPRLAAEVEGFEPVSTSRFALSSRQADVYVVRARRTEPAGGGAPATSQVQAWVWAGSHRMVVFSCATTPAREEVDVPLFDQVIASLRLLVT
jgi:hypothetical protein